ncbi:MAG: Rpn family recombination-promoting nuclease/putative transposase, partial [Planctomycetaceae bacterium]|nr:Rpn family recombination-promoting nuclease/putative transposase [Planctomycetaceae bacterium]
MGTRKTTPATSTHAKTASSSRSPVPATRDTFVHYLFGTKKYEPILLSFINAVLENGGRSKVASVETLNPFDPATFVTEKYTILDVKA